MWELIAIVVLVVLLALMTGAFLREWHEANMAQERWLADKQVAAWERTLELPARSMFAASQVQPVPDLMSRRPRERTREPSYFKFRGAPMPPPPMVDDDIEDEPEPEPQERPTRTEDARWEG